VNVGNYPIDYPANLMTYCLANDITFVNILEILDKQISNETKDPKNPVYQELCAQLNMRTEFYSRNQPSLYTPDLIANLIKKHVTAFPSSKYVLVYGYPAADDFSNENFPRSLDEFYQIEAKLGPVKALITVRPDAEDYNVEDPLEQKPVVEVIKPTKTDDDGGDDDANNQPLPDTKKDDPPPADDDDPEKAKLFKPEMYTWTTSNGNPKKLSQIYHQVGCDHRNLEVSQSPDDLLNAISKSIADFEAGETKRLYLEVIQANI